MTEQEWLNCTEPNKMLEFLSERASDRKLRLFAVACCRRIWQLLKDERSREGIEAAERFADNAATEKELTAAAASSDEANLQHSPLTFGGTTPWGVVTAFRTAASSDDDDIPNAAFAAAAATACSFKLADGPPGEYVAGYVAHHAAHAVEAAGSATTDTAGTASYREERAFQSWLLRDIFGNPFRPVAADRTWLTSTVFSLAEGIYADRAFDRLPILADALQDAGCDNADILTHCRSGRPHVRGCWVVDLILSKDR